MYYTAGTNPGQLKQWKCGEVGSTLQRGEKVKWRHVSSKWCNPAARVSSCLDEPGREAAKSGSGHQHGHVRLAFRVTKTPDTYLWEISPRPRGANLTGNQNVLVWHTRGMVMWKGLLQSGAGAAPLRCEPTKAKPCPLSLLPRVNPPTLM